MRPDRLQPARPHRHPASARSTGPRPPPRGAPSAPPAAPAGRCRRPRASASRSRAAGSSSARSSALRTLRVPITQAATRLMLASKKSSATRHPVQSLAAHQLVGDGLGLVVQQHHVVAVPADAAADVEQEPVDEAAAPPRSCRRRPRSGGSGRCRGRASVLPAGGVGQVELVASRRCSSRPRSRRACPPPRPGGARAAAARPGSRRAPPPAAAAGRTGRSGRSLHAVRDPDVHHRRRAQRRAEVALTSRLAWQWSIQNRRMAGSGWESVPRRRSSGGRSRWG